MSAVHITPLSRNQLLDLESLFAALIHHITAPTPAPFSSSSPGAFSPSWSAAGSPSAACSPTGYRNSNAIKNSGGGGINASQRHSGADDNSAQTKTKEEEDGTTDNSISNSHPALTGSFFNVFSDPFTSHAWRMHDKLLYLVWWSHRPPRCAVCGMQDAWVPSCNAELKCAQCGAEAGSTRLNDIVEDRGGGGDDDGGGGGDDDDDDDDDDIGGMGERDNILSGGGGGKSNNDGDSCGAGASASSPIAFYSFCYEWLQRVLQSQETPSLLLLLTTSAAAAASPSAKNSNTNTTWGSNGNKEESGTASAGKAGMADGIKMFVLIPTGPDLPAVLRAAYDMASLLVLPGMGSAAAAHVIRAASLYLSLVLHRFAIPFPLFCLAAVQKQQRHWPVEAEEAGRATLAHVNTTGGGGHIINNDDVDDDSDDDDDAPASPSAAALAATAAVLQTSYYSGSELQWVDVELMAALLGVSLAEFFESAPVAGQYLQNVITLASLGTSVPVPSILWHPARVPGRPALITKELPLQQQRRFNSSSNSGANTNNSTNTTATASASSSLFSVAAAHAAMPHRTSGLSPDHTALVVALELARRIDAQPLGRSSSGGGCGDKGSNNNSGITLSSSSPLSHAQQHAQRIGQWLDALGLYPHRRVYREYSYFRQKAEKRRRRREQQQQQRDKKVRGSRQQDNDDDEDDDDDEEGRGSVVSGSGFDNPRKAFEASLLSVSAVQDLRATLAVAKRLQAQEYEDVDSGNTTTTNKKKDEDEDNNDDDDDDSSTRLLRHRKRRRRRMRRLLSCPPSVIGDAATASALTTPDSPFAGWMENVFPSPCANALLHVFAHAFHVSPLDLADTAIRSGLYGGDGRGGDDVDDDASLSTTSHFLALLQSAVARGKYFVMPLSRRVSAVSSYWASAYCALHSCDRLAFLAVLHQLSSSAQHTTRDRASALARVVQRILRKHESADTHQFNYTLHVTDEHEKHFRGIYFLSSVLMDGAVATFTCLRSGRKTITFNARNGTISLCFFGEKERLLTMTSSSTRLRAHVRGPLIAQLEGESAKAVLDTVLGASGGGGMNNSSGGGGGGNAASTAAAAAEQWGSVVRSLDRCGRVRRRMRVPMLASRLDALASIREARALGSHPIAGAATLLGWGETESVLESPPPVDVIGLRTELQENLFSLPTAALIFGLSENRIVAMYASLVAFLEFIAAHTQVRLAAMMLEYTDSKEEKKSERSRNKMKIKKHKSDGNNVDDDESSNSSGSDHADSDNGGDDDCRLPLLAINTWIEELLDTNTGLEGSNNGGGGRISPYAYGAATATTSGPQPSPMVRPLTMTPVIGPTNSGGGGRHRHHTTGLSSVTITTATATTAAFFSSSAGRQHGGGGSGRPNVSPPCTPPSQQQQLYTLTPVMGPSSGSSANTNRRGGGGNSPPNYSLGGNDTDDNSIATVAMSAAAAKALRRQEKAERNKRRRESKSAKTNRKRRRDSSSSSSSDSSSSSSDDDEELEGGLDGDSGPPPLMLAASATDVAAAVADKRGGKKTTATTTTSAARTSTGGGSGNPSTSTTSKNKKATTSPPSSEPTSGSNSDSSSSDGEGPMGDFNRLQKAERARIDAQRADETRRSVLVRRHLVLGLPSYWAVILGTTNKSKNASGLPPPSATSSSSRSSRSSPSVSLVPSAAASLRNSYGGRSSGGVVVATDNSTDTNTNSCSSSSRAAESAITHDAFNLFSAEECRRRLHSVFVFVREFQQRRQRLWLEAERGALRAIPDAALIQSLLPATLSTSSARMMMMPPPPALPLTATVGVRIVSPNRGGGGKRTRPADQTNIDSDSHRDSGSNGTDTDSDGGGGKATTTPAKRARHGSPPASKVPSTPPRQQQRLQKHSRSRSSSPPVGTRPLESIRARLGGSSPPLEPRPSEGVSGSGSRQHKRKRTDDSSSSDADDNADNSRNKDGEVTKATTTTTTTKSATAAARPSSSPSSSSSSSSSSPANNHRSSSDNDEDDDDDDGPASARQWVSGRRRRRLEKRKEQKTARFGGSGGSKGNSPSLGPVPH